MQKDAQLLYAWCRHCDDVVDGQTLGGDAPSGDLTEAERRALLDDLKRKTEKSLAGERVDEPAFDAFAYVAERHNFPSRYPYDHLDGFEHDVAPRTYETLDDVLVYCYGVAGVVGVMMAILMGVKSDDETTLDRACDLGLAFQLTNICRDVIDDANGGRVYLPAEFLARQQLTPTVSDVLASENRDALWRTVQDVLDVADAYYKSATVGVRSLPPRAAAAVAAARNVYRDIGQKIRQRGPSAWETRVVVSKPRKTWLALAGAVTGGSASVFLSPHKSNRDATLWRRQSLRR